MSRLSSEVLLAVLGGAIFGGASDGIPLLDFHEFPGGRQYQLDRDALVASGVRLLTLERLRERTDFE